jgi:hypothetical protein
MTTTFVIDVLGWTGAALLLTAYFQVSAGRWQGHTPIFQALNIAGSLLFIVNSGYHGAYPSMFVNVVWAGIALFALARLRGARVTTSDRE